MITEENLNPDATRSFIDAASRDCSIQSTSAAITKVLPQASRFGSAAHEAAPARRKEEPRAGETGRFPRPIPQADAGLESEDPNIISFTALAYGG